MSDFDLKAIVEFAVQWEPLTSGDLKSLEVAVELATRALEGKSDEPT